VLVGDGESRPEIERYVAERNLGDAVLLLGQRDDIPAILKRCHIGLLVSRREGMPVSVLEYMLARLPVIATDLPGVDEMVKRDETGVLLNEPDPETLGAAMARLAADADLRRRMGEEGRRVATQPPFDDRAAIEQAERHIVECISA
jgi:glycosyltransferase involved in cell wall biosynthesis